MNVKRRKRKERKRQRERDEKKYDNRMFSAPVFPYRHGDNVYDDDGDGDRRDAH